MQRNSFLSLVGLWSISGSDISCLQFVAHSRKLLGAVPKPLCLLLFQSRGSILVLYLVSSWLEAILRFKPCVTKVCGTVERLATRTHVPTCDPLRNSFQIKL